MSGTRALIAPCLATLMTLQAATQPATPPGADLVRQQQLVFQHAWQTATGGIVRIDTIGGAQPIEKVDATPGEERTAVGFRQADGPSTGVIWSPDGWILTSSFNFYRDPTVITVTLADGRRFVAKLIARDLPARIALLKVAANGLPAARSAPTRDLHRGQWALTLGMGYGSASPAVSVGIISGLARMNGIAVQTDAKISPANYGGPLIDLEGRVLGICVPLGAGEDVTAGVEWYDSGIGFAITSEFLNERLPRLQAGQTLERGLLGIALDPEEPVVSTDATTTIAEPVSPGVTSAPASAPAGGGVRIAVPPIGPSAAAGLLEGDWITAVGSSPVRSSLDFRRAMAHVVASDEIKIAYVRDGTPLEVRVKCVSARELRASAPDSQP